ncbi:hypothetical protein Hdeb2414_s0004g00135291 [Helianthus debilis subsp. tardiflorus]
MKFLCDVIDRRPFPLTRGIIFPLNTTNSFNPPSCFLSFHSHFLPFSPPPYSHHTHHRQPWPSLPTTTNTLTSHHPPPPPACHPLTPAATMIHSITLFILFPGRFHYPTKQTLSVVARVDLLTRKF